MTGSPPDIRISTNLCGKVTARGAATPESLLRSDAAGAPAERRGHGGDMLPAWRAKQKRIPSCTRKNQESGFVQVGISCDGYFIVGTKGTKSSLGACEWAS